MGSTKINDENEQLAQVRVDEIQLPDAIVTQQITIAQTGVAEAFDDVELLSGATLYADSDNAAAVTYGNATNQYAPVAAGEWGKFMEINNTSKIYVKGTADDVITLLGS